nr:hypothetical protein [Tolivirales sp.]
MFMTLTLRALGTTQARETGTTYKSKLLQPAKWEEDPETGKVVTLHTCRGARAVVCPLTAGMRDTAYWAEAYGDFHELLKPMREVFGRLGAGLTTCATVIKGLALSKCVEISEDWGQELERERRAAEVIDGPSDRAVSSGFGPEMYLTLADDVRLDPVHGGTAIAETVEVESNPTSLAIDPERHPHSVNYKRHSLENNYVIIKGKRGFYCHTLLSLLKARLGKLPHDALHEKIVRRHAYKECENHGLRPRDRLVAVEFVVQTYWHTSSIEREIGSIAQSYRGGERNSWLRRVYHRLRRALANYSNLSSLRE